MCLQCCCKLKTNLAACPIELDHGGTRMHAHDPIPHLRGRGGGGGGGCEDRGEGEKDRALWSYHDIEAHAKNLLVQSNFDSRSHCMVVHGGHSLCRYLFLNLDEMFALAACMGSEAKLKESG